MSVVAGIVAAAVARQQVVGNGTAGDGVAVAVYGCCWCGNAANCGGDD